MATNDQQHLAHLCIRGGTTTSWKEGSGTNYNLLTNEIAYESNIIEHMPNYFASITPSYTILKLNTGPTTNGSSLYENSSESDDLFYDDRVFFSGRGAGIMAAIPDENREHHLGAVRLHGYTDYSDDDEGKAARDKASRYGLCIDGQGFLSLWREKLLPTDTTDSTVLRVDHLETTTLTVKNINVEQDTTYSNDIFTLRDVGEEETTDLIGYAGLQIKDIKTTDDDVKLSSYMVCDGSGTWGIINYSSPTADYFHPILTMSSQLSVNQGPVKFINGTLEPWQPNTLDIRVNGEQYIIDSATNSSVYNPYTDNDNSYYINIPSVTAIKVITTEMSGEAEDTFTVDDNGLISIILPVVSETSFTAWNNKLDHIQFNGTDLQTVTASDGTKSCNIQVEQGTLSASNVICAPLQKIQYSNTILPIQNYISILPTIQSNTANEIAVAHNVDSNNIAISHIQHAAETDIIASIQIDMNSRSTDQPLHIYGFNECGHRTYDHQVYINVGNLIDAFQSKIDELQSQIDALRNS